MKKNIAVFEDLKFILSCDGNSLEVIGKSSNAEEIRKIVEDKNSSYNSIREEQGSRFDPVEYFSLSSMNFVPKYYDYLEEKLTELKKTI
jgi:hypothetical protein